MSGDYQRRGAHFRVVGRLTDPRTGAVAAIVNAANDDLFAIQDYVAETLAAALADAGR